MGMVVQFPQPRIEGWRVSYRRVPTNAIFQSSAEAKASLGNTDTRWVWVVEAGREFWLSADGHFSVERGHFHHEQVQGRSALDRI